MSYAKRVEIITEDGEVRSTMQDVSIPGSEGAKKEALQRENEKVDKELRELIAKKKQKQATK